MRIGASLLLIAIGAVLKFGVTAHSHDFSAATIGIILMVVGAVGMLITLALLTTRRRTDVVYGRNGVSYVEPADRYFFV
jgi:hypothetical protein